MKWLLPIIYVLAILAIGCVDLDDQAEPGDAISWMQTNTTRYLEDPAWRRAQIEASLWLPALPYARKRLAGYALPEGGWDLLPELAAVSGPVFPGALNDAELMEFPTHTPRSRQEWLELGEAVFWQMPMRQDAYLEWLVNKPELLDEVGVPRNFDGSLQGIVRFRDARGEQRVGATCGLCHGQNGVAGQATAALDLGRGRAHFNQAHGAPGEVYNTWGPGRVDVTDDAVSDPLQIPNLWALQHQSYLNTSGLVRIASPASFAIRFETQYIVGHGLEARPNRVLTWALAMFVLSLEPPSPSTPQTSLPGATVFDAKCAACHIPNAGYGGELVEAALMIDEAPAAYSPLRGTGLLKVPSLVGIGTKGPYLHDGRYATLEDLLDGRHPHGIALSAADKEDLLGFLQTL